MKKVFVLLLAAAAVASCGRGKYVYDASGAFEAVEVIVSSEVNGRLLEFAVEEGSEVRAGEVVGFVDTTQLYLKREQLLASRRSLASRRLDIATQIAATEQQIAAQKRERDRVARLLAADAATQKQLDDLESAVAVLERQLKAQRASLESNNETLADEGAVIDVQIAQIDDQLARSRVSSPIDGVVLVKYAERGELTAAGRPLFKVADIDRMTLRAYVTSGQMTTLRLGQEVRVFTDFGDRGVREYPGEVVWISDRAEFTPKTIQTRDERANLVYAVKISVPNDGYIKIGMYGDVKFD